MRKEDPLRVVGAEESRKRILDECHDVVSAGHKGFRELMRESLPCTGGQGCISRFVSMFKVALFVKFTPNYGTRMDLTQLA